MVKQTFTAAVVGCGRIGSLLARDHLRSHPCTHADIYARDPRTRLIGGADFRATRRAQFARDWGVPASAVFPTHIELLKQFVPDILSVATYTESHARITVDAARAGVKIVLCEKPIALTDAEAQWMIDVCRNHGTLLAIHHERRWVRGYRIARELIEDGQLGEIRTIVGNVLTGSPDPDWHSDPNVSGGGPTLHDGTHMFDILRYLCGEVVEVTGEIECANPKLRVEDTSRSVLKFAGGAVAFVECGGRRGYFNFELDIQGTTGRMIIGNGLRRFFSIGPSSHYEGFVEFVERPFPNDDRPDYYPHILDDILDAWEMGRDSVSSGADGAAALKIVREIYRSSELKF